MSKSKRKNVKPVPMNPFSPKGLLMGFINSIGASMVIYIVVGLMRKIPIMVNNKIQFHYGLFLPLLLGYFLFLYVLRNRLGDSGKYRVVTLFGFAIFATVLEMFMANMGMVEISMVAYISIILTMLIASAKIK